MNSSTIETFRRAVLAMQTGKAGESENLFKAVLREQPKHLAALNLLAVVLTQLGKYADAESYLRRALRESGKSDTTLYNYAIVLKALKRPDEALQRLGEALKINPTVAETWNNRGTVLSDLKRYADAVADFDRAIAINLNYADAFFNKGNALASLDLHQQSLAAYDRAVSLKPDLGEAWLGRGNAFNKLNQYDSAVPAFDRALALNADLVGAWLGRGQALAETGRFDDSLAAFDKALALDPDLAEAWLGRGNVLEKRDEHQDALAACERALALNPDLAEAWVSRGNIKAALNENEEASRAYDKALTLEPTLAVAWVGLGNLASSARRYDEALAAYATASRLKPTLANAWLGQGNILNALQRYEEALDAFDRSIALKPNLAPGWVGRGIMLLRTNRRNEAIDAFDRALTLVPDMPQAWHSRAYALFEINRVTEALAAFDKALALKPDYSEAISDKIFVLDTVEGIGFEEQQATRDYWWQKVGSVIAAQSRIEHPKDQEPNRQLRVGYVSADFRSHSAARSFRPMLLNHDKSAFEITCYSSSNIEDEVTRDFQRAADRWRCVAQVSDEELCKLIVADQIDILVDLSTHTAGHRLEVFARKPAPVQVSIGATGTGLKTIDYIFADPVICPTSIRHLFAEKIFDVPAIMTIEAIPELLEPSDPPVLTKGYVTFGIFNRISKISDDSVALWSRILDAVPQSRLLIKHYALDEEALRAKQLERFAAHGIAADRIGLLGKTSRRDHLAAFEQVDISLDPFPYNGSISTLESLQMGVPVVALLGSAATSRAAGSILTSAGLGDWVAESADGYLAIAAKFATMPDHLKELRREIPAMLRACALGNSVIYTKAVEAAYRAIWTDYCRAGPDRSAV